MASLQTLTLFASGAHRRNVTEFPLIVAPTAVAVSFAPADPAATEAAGPGLAAPPPPSVGGNAQAAFAQTSKQIPANAIPAAPAL